MHFSPAKGVGWGGGVGGGLSTPLYGICGPTGYGFVINRVTILVILVTNRI